MTTQQIDIKEYKKALKACQADLRVFINENNCNPILVRLAWHDSGTYDKNVKEWPLCGGANGSIIYKEVLSHGANAGLIKAVNYLKPFKTKYPLLSYADIIQMASAESILLAGGPKIDMIYGRLDTDICPKEGNLPDAAPPFKGEKSAKEHLQNVFFRMGFNSKEIVCLSGAHTLGRAFNERSGTTTYGYGASKGTKFTSGEHIARKDAKPGVGMPGGQSWTKNWLTFDNSYFTQERSKENGLLWLETDKAVAEDAEFKKWFEVYKKDEKAFFEDYKLVHKKLSELGSKFFVAGGVRIEDTGAKL